LVAGVAGVNSGRLAGRLRFANPTYGSEAYGVNRSKRIIVRASDGDASAAWSHLHCSRAKRLSWSL